MTTAQSSPSTSLLPPNATGGVSSWFFFAHKPAVPVPAVLWQPTLWEQQLPTTDSPVQVAHCIAGQARALVARPVQLALKRHFIHRFPGVQHLFVQFAHRFTPGKERSLISPSETDLIAVARALNATSFNISDAVDLPRCNRHVADCNASAILSVQWGTLRRCFAGQVVPYEEQHGFSFDFVTRIRPDAVFFSNIMLPPVHIMRRHVILPFRGLALGVLPNDHMAIAPRDQAPMMFSHLAELLLDCGDEGARARCEYDGARGFTYAYHEKGSKRVEKMEGVAAARLKYFGTSFLEIPWPYALSARACCCRCSAAASGCTWYGREETAGANHCFHSRPEPINQTCDMGCTVESVAATVTSCVLPLQCTRLAPDFNDLGLKSLPLMAAKVGQSTLPHKQTMAAYFAACRNVSVWPEAMRGPCAVPSEKTRAF